MARTSKPKPELYLFAQLCPDPATRRAADHWHGYAGYVSLQACHIDRSGGELKPKFLEEYGEDPARAYRELTFACMVNTEMMTTAELSYGWRVGFHHFNSENFPLEPREIGRMHGVLQPLVRAYEKECERVGRPKSFGQFVLWHLGSLDLRGIIKRGEGSFEGMFTLFTDSLADTIDQQVLRVAEDLARLGGMESSRPAGKRGRHGLLQPARAVARTLAPRILPRLTSSRTLIRMHRRGAAQCGGGV